MRTQTALSFLKDLAQNNSLDWMHANKARYQEAMTAFTEIVTDLIGRLSETEPALTGMPAEKLIFRLNRDTRFSHDKSPYNPSFRAHISSAGRIPIPAGYFLNVMPEAVMLGGGVFAAQFPAATTLVRDAIVNDGGAFAAIVKDPAFRENFILQGEKLKNVPRGYDPAHPQAEYLKHKSWFIEYIVPETVFLDECRFLELATEKFLLMRPLNGFLNNALKSFQFPARP